MAKAKSAEKLPDVVGDYGEGISAKRVGLQNTRMIERAIREGWPIPDEYRKPIIDRQVKIAVDPSITPRESTSATRAILMAERQNMIRERLALELAGLVGASRDPFEGQPDAAVIQATQIVIHLPDNQRTANGIVIDARNGNATTTGRGKAKPARRRRTN